MRWEFGGKVWLAWLAQQGIGFRIRINGDTLIANAQGQMVSAHHLFLSCRVGEECALSGKRRCLGQALFVVGTRLADGELLIVLSEKEAPLSDYTLRSHSKLWRCWGIETLFGALKTRGFNLEATHVTKPYQALPSLTKPERLAKLLALLSIAFTWAFVAGEWCTKVKTLKLKKHGRPARSIFRTGLDWLRRVLISFCGQTNQKDLQIAADFLSCT